MSTTITQNPIELRKAGMKALNTALGHRDAQAFLMQFTGTGDWTKERREIPDRPFEDVKAEILKLQDSYARGAVDIAGRPV